MRRSLHVGLFADDRDLLDAVRECREREIPILDVVTPFPLHELDEAMGLRRSRLPWVTLIGGAVGLAIGLGFQYWSSAVNWPLDVGGKPFDSLPAFVPVAFEMTILLAGLSTAGALFFRSKLWPGRKPPRDLEATTDDRHALVLTQADAAFREEDFVDLWQRHGAESYRMETEELS
jgi:hypothetical protein